MNEDRFTQDKEALPLEGSHSTCPTGSEPELGHETEDIVAPTELVDLDVLSEDEVIVFLEDDDLLEAQQDIPVLLSQRPGEDVSDDDLEDLPEITAELVDDLPEVDDVEDITSLVEDSDEVYEENMFDNAMSVVEQVREYAIANWKPGAIAAAVLLGLVLLINVPWTGSDSAPVGGNVTSAAVVEFENWIDDVLDQHQAGIGVERQ